MKESKILFIDRDGVINVDPIGDYIKTWKDFRFETGVLKVLKKISDAGYELVIISNQAGIGDGIYPESALWDIHQNMLRVFSEQGIRVRGAYYCLHGKEEGCRCRKPQTGLFEKAASEISFNRAQTYFVGDKASDMEAGKRFGLKTIFVRTGHGRYDEPKLNASIQPDYLINNLSEILPILCP